MDSDSSFDRLKELELTRDEVERLTDALKKEEFRKLFIEYVKEIQDPENKKIYEQEIVQLEKERGVDCTFLHPQPCYVIKTSLNGEKKAFINICGNDLVDKPSANPEQKDGSKGLNWSLPHSISPPREDVDNKNVRCKVFDVLFHPDTLHLAIKNKTFKEMVNNVACTAIESNFNAQLDKKNLKFPKLKYKGVAHPSVIRKQSKDAPVERSEEEKEFFDKLYAEVDERRNDSKPKSTKKKSKKVKPDIMDDLSNIYATPKYVIKQRSHVDLQDCTDHKGAKLNSATPKEIIVEVNLPLLKSSSDITLDVTEKTLSLTSEKPAKYKLNITLPYQVNQDNGNAKFDKDKKIIYVTLPVNQKVNIIMSDFTREDSGIESDHGTPIFEEIDTKKLVSETSEFSERKTEIIAERTSFLDEKLCYNLPEFTCHVYNKVIAFTLNVKNVHEHSVKFQTEKNENRVHVQFVSVSPSYFQEYFAFCVQLPNEILEDSVSVETWDNNLILQVSYLINDNEDLEYYLFGTSPQDFRKKFVEEPSILHTILEESLSNETILNESLPSPLNLPQDHTYALVPKTEAININGTICESSSDELSCSFSPSKSRGILKQPNRKILNRSVSESSMDDPASSFDNYGTSFESAIPEDGEISTSLKKTVRFNEIVSKQIYRFNSSILGQKKKNQRKAQKKKRAHDRRASESEASEVEDKERDKQTSETSGVDEENDDIEMSMKKEDSDIFDLDM